MTRNEKGNPCEPNDNALDDIRQELVVRIGRWVAEEEVLDLPIPGMAFHRYTKPTVPVNALHEPGICFVVQGTKRVQLKETEYLYDANQYLFTSVNLPIIANIVDASPEQPFVGILWELDLRAASQLIADSHLPRQHGPQTKSGLALGSVTPELLNIYSRVLDLLDKPEDIPILAPLLHKELLYRLLSGEQGDRLRQITRAESHSQKISKAIDWILEHFNETLRMEELASYAGMSKSTFNLHFRSVTSMSPLQFQKWMRLHEARTLMLSEDYDAASASLQVGYESPTQFSREYSRQFGAPPKQDIKKLQ